VKTLSRPAAFWLLALTLSALLFASSAPSPLYVVYQAEWDFSAITLTAVFAVYALALLGSLLVAGSISDHIGRRPTLFIALAIEIAAMATFAAAGSVEWLFAARILQGLATGIAMGCISAALLDLEPPDKPWLGALTGAAAPMAGLATGALVTGLLVDYAPGPTGLVFWLMLGVFVLAVLVAIVLPETVTKRPGWRASMRPRIGVPPHVRAPFVAALPTMAATWALGGLVLSLGPSLTAGVLGADSHLMGALPIFAMAGISGVASVVIRQVDPRAAARGGLTALIAGIALVFLALEASSNALFLTGAAVCGLGFGPSFAGVFRSLTAMAHEERRAELTSSVLAVAYLAFSGPALLAGIAVTQVGLQETAEVYAVVLIVVASVALLLSSRLEGASAPEPAEAVAALR
jgi:MFS family permease